MLPNRLRRRVSALGAFTVPMLRGADTSTVDPALLTELAGACRDSERLRFSYRSHGGSDSRRTVDPHRLVCTEHRWYLVVLKAPVEEAARRISPSAGVLEPVDERTCRLTAGAPDLDVLVIHVLLMGIDFEVVEPPGLVEVMVRARDRLDRALNGEKV